MYVAVKGGQRAIENAHKLFADRRRGDRAVPSLTLEQIAQQLAFSVDRVMSERSLYDRELAALAVKQSAGDLAVIAAALHEAVGNVRAALTWLLEQNAANPANPGAVSYHFLMLLGTVTGGWQMARAALAALVFPWVWPWLWQLVQWIPWANAFWLEPSDLLIGQVIAKVTLSFVLVPFLITGAVAFARWLDRDAA